ncbi:hypothetical protein KKF84_09590, partial [Myxococcota bacterium]|nr:hypothetical protein [Myxococcota bacterium]
MMLRFFLLAPALLILTAACTKPPPGTRIAWRTCRRVKPAGPTISLLPLDVRARYKWHVSLARRAALWNAAKTTAEAMTEALPEVMEKYGFTINRMVTWNGTVITRGGDTKHVVSEKQMARAMSALAFFVKTPNTGSLNHMVAPGALSALAPHSDLSLYVASWYTVGRPRSTFGAYKFLDVLVTVMAAVILGIITAGLENGLSSSGSKR